VPSCLTDLVFTALSTQMRYNVPMLQIFISVAKIYFRQKVKINKQKVKRIHYTFPNVFTLRTDE